MKKELVYQYGVEELNAVKELQSKDVARQRLAFMDNTVGGTHSRLGMSSRKFSVSKTWWNEGIMYYAVDVYTLFLSASGKLFTRSNNLYGFTYEPENNHTFKLWHKTRMHDVPNSIMEDMLKFVGAEWALEKHDMGEYAQPTVMRMLKHKGLFQRILKGRITNAEDLVRAWLKVDTRWRELKISHRAKSILTLIRQGVDMADLIDFLSIVNNVEATLDMMLNGKRMGRWGKQNPDTRMYEQYSDFAWYEMGNMQRDMVKELTVLDRKINSTWSHKRLMAEHTAMSRELLALQVEHMELKDHGYQSPCPVLPGMELIRDNVRLFAEGKNMHHCVYGYLDGAQTYNYFHFHCTFGTEPFTLAVQSGGYGENTRWVVQQMYGKYNKSCSNAQHDIVRTWLDEPAVQEWFDIERGNTTPTLDPLPF